MLNTILNIGELLIGMTAFVIQHISQLNMNKNLLHLVSFDNIDVLGEYQSSEFLQDYDILIRKYDDIALQNMGILHYGFMHSSESDDVIQYYGEGDNKNDAEVKKMKIWDFVKSNQNYEFYIYRINKEHLNCGWVIHHNVMTRLGEKKYNLLTNNCENLCLDILIKPEYKYLYKTQVEYLTEFFEKNNDQEQFYNKKKEFNKIFLKQLIPCKYNPVDKKIIVYKNILDKLLVSESDQQKVLGI